MKKIWLLLLPVLLLIFLPPYIISDRPSQNGLSGCPPMDPTAYRLAIKTAQELIRGYGETFQKIAFPENEWEYSVERNGENWTVSGYVDLHRLRGGIRKRFWKTSFRMEVVQCPGSGRGSAPVQMGEKSLEVVVGQSTIQRIETVLFLLLTILWTKNDRPA